MGKAYYKVQGSEDVRKPFPPLAETGTVCWDIFNFCPFSFGSIEQWTVRINTNPHLKNSFYVDVPLSYGPKQEVLKAWMKKI